MKLLKINTKREELLNPLVKWKILGVQELGELSHYPGTKRNLQKLLQRCEEDGLVKTFTHSISSRKFIYLTRNAYKELSNDRYNVNEDIIMHDAIVSSLLYRFSNYRFITNPKINYQDVRFSESLLGKTVDIDASIRADIDGDIYNIAIEVELVRKSSTRVIEKFKAIHESTEFDLAIYFFRSLKTLDNYASFYNNYCEKNNISIRQKIIMFCHSEKLANSTMDIMRSYWLRPDGICSNLAELFGYDLVYKQAIDTPWTGDEHVH